MSALTPDPCGRPAQPIVVLGVGNLLRGDDGVGVHAIRELSRREDVPPSARLVDGGVMGLDLLTELQDCAALVLIDALDAGAAPGSVIRLDGNQVTPAVTQKLSMHQAGVRDLLAAAELMGQAPPTLVVWGVQPASLDWQTTLSPPVAAALPDLVERIVRELRAMTA